MKISYKYLKNFLNTKLSQKKLSEVFTRVGLECESKGQILEFDVTPNRGDILSLRGLQREFDAFQSKKSKNSLYVSKINPRSDKSIVKNIDKNACGNYYLLLIKGIGKLKQLDSQKRDLLINAGIPLINPLVDLGNYVMLEIGAPMHIFDLDRLSLPINVIFPNSKKSIFKAIGGDLKNVYSDTLTIQDNSGIQAIAGIIGGNDSSVKKNTKNIAVEAAFFKPDKIVNQARRYGLATDASHRFERGVDPKIQKLALERYLYLLQNITSFETKECFSAEHTYQNKKPVSFCIDRFNSFSGLQLKMSHAKKILKNLEFNLISESNKNSKFFIPSHRFDIELEEDLYEEILRCFGYDNVPNSTPTLGPKPKIFSQNLTLDLKLSLVHAGFKELMHMPFVSHETNNSLSSKSFKPVEIANPINENEPLLRGSLFGSLFSAVNYNIKKGYSSIKIFEHANVFNKTHNSYKQESHLSGLIYNHEPIRSWSLREFQYDFFTLKAEIIKLLKICGIQDIKFKNNKKSNVFSINALNIFVGKRLIGTFGEIDLSKTQKKIKKPCYGFELYPNKIFDNKKIKKLTKSSKFPSSARDLNIIISKEFHFDELEEKIVPYINHIKHVKSFKLINIFEGEGIPHGFSSMTLRFIFQSQSKSLLDKEISSRLDKISLFLQDNFKVSIRK